MKRVASVIVVSLILALLAGSLQARVVYEGVLDRVFPERRSVIIDRQEMRFSADARIILESDPEKDLDFSVLRRGQRVIYDLIYLQGQEPRINLLILLD